MPWGNSPDGFGGVARDVATFWTGRNLKDGSNTGNIGYSFFAGICNEKGYNIVEDFFTTVNNAHASIWIHELGHTWNTYHVADNPQNMMSPNIYGNNGSEPTNRVVTSGTLNSIETHRDSRTCLADGCTNVGIEDIANTIDIIEGYPNPFTSQATIGYKINNSSKVKISIYNGMGQLVFEKYLGVLPKGKHMFAWDGRSNTSKTIPAGFYSATISMGTNQLKNIRLIKY